MWPFKRKQNALAVLQNSNAELRQLLFLEQQHSAELLKMLANSMGNNGENIAKEKGTPTPTQAKVLAMLNEQDSITNAYLCSKLGYRQRQVGNGLLLRMIKKNLLQKIGSGKNTSYKLAD